MKRKAPSVSGGLPPRSPHRQDPSLSPRVRQGHARPRACCCPSPAPTSRCCPRHGAKGGSFRPHWAPFAGCDNSLLSIPNTESVHLPVAIQRRSRGRPGAPRDGRADRRGIDCALALLTSRTFVDTASIGRTALRSTGPLKYGPSIKRLAAPLLQQSVDERAPEHVEKTASTYSIGA